MNFVTVIKNLKSQDHKTFREVVYKYSGVLMTVAKFYSKNNQDAEDTLQEAFIAVFRKINTFSGDEERAFVGWMKKIVTNCALERYRRHYYKKESYTLEDINSPVEEAVVLEQYEYEDLMNAIYNLPLKYKRIVGLYALEGYSHKEIGEMLDIKSSTSRSIYSRATNKLKTTLSNKLKVI